MTVTVVIGTRPEIIKMAPVIRELESRNVNFFILHTGQHYSYELDRVFFEQLRLPQAKYNLEVGSGPHSAQTAKILAGAGQVLEMERPDVILVEGDTNSVLAAALAASKLNIKVGHVESGLRSYDRRMPEEVNRILTDHCSDYLFAPTEKAKATLLLEGLSEDRIFVTGNTVVDAVYQNLEISRELSNTLNVLQLRPKEYLLVTLHRQENIENPERFASILKGLDTVSSEFQLPAIYPIHPHSRRKMQDFHLEARNILIIDPVDFLGFLQLESNARLILTDSGGVQEESCVLGVPCVTLRDNTERPETLEVNANILAGTTAQRILECARIMLGRGNSWSNPFGDGKAGERIVSIIRGAVHG